MKNVQFVDLMAELNLSAFTCTGHIIKVTETFHSFHFTSST